MPAKHRDHGVDDVGREASELRDGVRLSVRRQSENSSSTFTIMSSISPLLNIALTEPLARRAQ